MVFANNSFDVVVAGKVIRVFKMSGAKRGKEKASGTHGVGGGSFLLRGIRFCKFVYILLTKMLA